MSLSPTGTQYPAWVQIAALLYLLRKLYFGLRQSYISAFSRSDILAIAKVKVNPQRAKGTHRAKGASLLPTGKNIASSL